MPLHVPVCRESRTIKLETVRLSENFLKFDFAILSLELINFFWFSQFLPGSILPARAETGTLAPAATRESPVNLANARIRSLCMECQNGQSLYGTRWATRAFVRLDML